MVLYSCMENKKFEKLIIYWRRSIVDNLKTMDVLYRARRYSDCLFFGHLILEKTFKLLVMRQTRDYAPRIHNLLRLAELSKAELSEDEWGLLSEANEFNIAARYADDKYSFYKKCTKVFADDFYKPIKLLYKKLWALNK